MNMTMDKNETIKKVMYIKERQSPFAGVAWEVIPRKARGGETIIELGTTKQNQYGVYALYDSLNDKIDKSIIWVINLESKLGWISDNFAIRTLENKKGAAKVFSRIEKAITK